VFIRWNSTNNYYEYDTSAAQDGAGPWNILNINGACLNNYIQVPNTISAGSYLQTSNGLLYFGGGDANGVLISKTGSTLFFVTGDTVAYANIQARDIKSVANFYEKGRTVPLGEWQSYNPSWTSLSNPQPILGNGLLQGYYTLVGKTCFYYLRWDIGSTTGLGNGAYKFSMPSVGGVMLNIEWSGFGELYVGGSRINIYSLNQGGGYFSIMKQTNAADGGSTELGSTNSVVGYSARLHGYFSIP
jgi:hypothetical protein